MNPYPLLARILPWVVIAVLVFNMSQRRFMGVGAGKRLATLKLAGLVMVFWVATIAFRRFDVPGVYLIPAGAVLVAAAVLLRKSLFPYRLHCSSCGETLSLKRILYEDETRCSRCAEVDRPEVEQ